MTNNKGFSLVELMVSVGIMSIVILMATAMMSNASRFFEKQTAQVELQNKAQVVTNYISEAFMEASGMDFNITDSNNSGTYQLFTVDPTDATKSMGKGIQRILYYDYATTSLYIVSFDSEQEIPLVMANDGYLISDEITEFEIKFAEAEVHDDTTTAPADGSTPPKIDAVINPVKVTVVFTMAHNTASSKFEVTADCRSHLNEVVVTDSSGTTTYKAFDR
ncbi:MAG: prepilin-type N-terminal cleavage/methylation domain-containing protein [Thermoflexaceae bacterium]|nr:prepilin-type N-terminal cleavage/methylation domain-containing protein [Thermoflexaceae bacterium]